MALSSQIQTAQPLPPMSRVAFGVAVAILGWETRKQTRRKLALLDEHLLNDIGLSPAEAEAETEKPFWRD